MPIVFQNDKIVFQNGKIVFDCDCCEIADPYYCARIRVYYGSADCGGGSPGGSPDEDYIACMRYTDILMYGGWDTCFNGGGYTVWLTYSSGPYAASNCNGICSS